MGIHEYLLVFGNGEIMTPSQKRKVKYINKIFAEINSISEVDAEYSEDMKMSFINKYLMQVSEGTLKVDAMFIDTKCNQIKDALKEKKAKQKNG